MLGQIRRLWRCDHLVSLVAFSDRLFHNAMSLSRANITRTPLPPMPTLTFPPFLARCSSSQTCSCGSSLLSPSNSRAPAIPSSLMRLTISHTPVRPIRTFQDVVGRRGHQLQDLESLIV